ncbi:Pvc16 family protein [Arthrobacter humicola]
MTDYSTIRGASLTLRDLFKEHITDDPDLTLSGVPIDLRSPRELELATLTDAVSVWLYRVVLQPDLVNQPGRRINPGETERCSTPLQLSYLITPMHTNPLTEHTLMGRAIQVIRDHGQLGGSSLRGVLAGSPTTMKLSFEMSGTAEQNTLWWSLQSQHRAAISLIIEGVAIDSHLPPQSSPPDLTQQFGYAQIVSVT